MNRIESHLSKLKEKGEKAFITYITAGLPDMNHVLFYWGFFPAGSVVKNPPSEARDTGVILCLGRSPAEGNGNSLQYS